MQKRLKRIALHSMRGEDMRKRPSLEDEMIRAAIAAAAQKRGQTPDDWLKRAILVRLAVEGVVITDRAA
jgi:hypothetical protein